MPTASGRNSSRGYLKIAAGAGALGVDFRGRVVLDIGSSTGGFTQYALERGAARVIAIEKGTRQMRAPLCLDPRVELHEKTDIFSVVMGKPSETKSTDRSASSFTDNNFYNGKSLAGHLGRVFRSVDLPSSAFPDIILADVSFLSLTKILKYASMYLAGPGTQLLVMLKPQFEAVPRQLVRGVVKNEKIRREIIGNFEVWLRANHYVILGKRDNALPGLHGNTERFYYLKMANKLY